MPIIPVISNGLLPTLSIILIAIIVNKTVVKLRKTPDKKAASVPMPVCLNIDVA